MSNWVQPTSDTVAPDAVRDLSLYSALPGSGEFVVTWTAPGDDPGYGSGLFIDIFQFFLFVGVSQCIQSL